MALMACNGSKSTGENPFFTEWDTPFGVPPFDKITAEDYLPAFERAMSLQNEEIEQIVTSKAAPLFKSVIEPFDASGQMLSDVYNVFDMVRSADTSDAMQKIQEQIAPMIAAHSDKIMMNEALFAKIKTVYDSRATASLNDEQMRLVEKIYTSFVRSGALLTPENKERLKAINGELSSIGVKFGNNILAENNKFRLELTTDQLSGLPASVRDAAKERAEQLGLKERFVFTLHKPSLLPFLTYSTDRALREKIYKAYINRCNNGDENDNKALINDFIRLRTEKAHLLGYDSYAAYVTADQMSKNPAAVYSLLNEVWTPALDRAKEELTAMTELMHNELPSAKFESWDWWYYAEKLRSQNYALDEEMLRPYFSLANVQSGIFFLANRLYGITFRPIVAPVYNKECSVYEVLDADNSHLGVLYFDFFPRAGKGQGAWCGYFREQRYKEGKREAPVVGIVCNFTPPTQSAPALLSIDETQTLFHEFGHALHFLFHDVKYRRLADVEGDFVELPSQIMENWALEPEVLAQYATNYRTGEVIPNYMVDKIRRSMLFNQGFMTTELVASALSDMDIHSIKEYSQINVNDFERNALNTQRGLIPQIEPRYHYPYFSHIFDGGYSAGYYFYIWAEVLDKDAFQAFKESGDLFNRKIANSLRRNILARGGSADGMTLYRTFRGAEPDKTAMLRGRGLCPEPIDSIATSTTPSL